MNDRGIFTEGSQTHVSSKKWQHLPELVDMCTWKNMQNSSKFLAPTPSKSIRPK